MDAEKARLLTLRSAVERASVAPLRESEETLSTTLHSIGDVVLATGTGGVTRIKSRDRPPFLFHQ